MMMRVVFMPRTNQVRGIFMHRPVQGKKTAKAAHGPRGGQETAFPARLQKSGCAGFCKNGVIFPASIQPQLGGENEK